MTMDVHWNDSFRAILYHSEVLKLLGIICRNDFRCM